MHKENYLVFYDNVDKNNNLYIYFMCQALKNCINRIQLFCNFFFFILLYCLVQTPQLFLADAGKLKPKKCIQTDNSGLATPLFHQQILVCSA